MAIYHLSIKIFSRGKGASVTAKAAYRAAECITSEYDGITSDYTRKGGVIHKEILLPENAPREYQDRSVLWNAVEKSERYKTAQLAREVEVALPKELTESQNIRLVREYVKKNFVQHGMCVDLCIHDKGDGNPHAHIMLTMRPISENGKWGAKSKTVDGVKIPTVDWSDRKKAEIWRAEWAKSCNEFLGHTDKDNPESRLDHRSYERQGVDKIPGVHMGVAASQMERKGTRTDRGNINRAVEVTNKELRQLKARIRKCKDWVYSQPIENPPSMMSVLSAVSKGDELNARWRKIADLKTSAKILCFLQSNNISDISQLADKIKNVNNELSEVASAVKKIDRRLEGLDFLIEQTEIRKKHKAVYEQYNNIQPSLADKVFGRDPKEEFYLKHSAEILDYQSADDCLKEYLNGKVKSTPLKKWKAEREQLTAERLRQCEKFYSLKDETRSVELIRKGVDVLFTEQEKQRERQRTRGKDSQGL